MKTCTSCKVAKELSDFNRETASPDGRQRMCRACAKLHQRRWYRDNFAEIQADYRENAEQRVQYNRERMTRLRAEDPRLVWARNAFDSAKRRAARAGVAFDLDVPFIRSIAADSCPVFGMSLAYPAGAPGRHKLNDASATLDRLIGSEGYVRGNVAVISFKANRIKTDATADEVGAVAAWFKAALRPRRIA